MRILGYLWEVSFKMVTMDHKLSQRWPKIYGKMHFDKAVSLDRQYDSILWLNHVVKVNILRHVCKSLFCPKKTLKTQGKYNLWTHHQRSPVKSKKDLIFGPQNKDWWQFNIIFSNEVKANIRLGTEGGMTGVGNKVMWQWTGDKTGRKVPTAWFLLL